MVGFVEVDFEQEIEEAVSLQVLGGGGGGGGDGVGGWSSIEEVVRERKKKDLGWRGRGNDNGIHELEYKLMDDEREKARELKRHKG